MKKRLTEIGIRKLAFTQMGQITYWDELTPGFAVRVSTKSKSFVVMYGKRRNLKTLGRYPNLSLSEARQKAKIVLLNESTNTEVPREIYFDDAVDIYLTECVARLKTCTVGEYRLYLKRFTFSKTLSAIKRQDVMEQIKERSRTPASQNHAFTAAKVFFNWAVMKDFIQTNPLAAAKRPNRSISRDRILDNDELSTLLRHTLENRGRFNDIVSLLVLTGQRRGEIANLEWSDVNDDLLILSGDKTKNKRPHQVPLSKKAQEIVRTIAGNEKFLFTSANASAPFSGWSRSKARMDKHLGLSGYTLHDLRRTFSSNLAMLGTPIHVTEKLLNHVSGTISGVAAVYNRHSYMEEMKYAVRQHDNFLEELIGR